MGMDGAGKTVVSQVTNNSYKFTSENMQSIYW